MKTSSDLYDLIHLLSQSEKRYIKLKSSFHLGNKQYLQLMSIIEQQGSYDAKALEEEWQKMSSDKSLAITKNYLYEFILTALEHYNANSKGKMTVLTLLKKVDILFDKALYSQCVKLLRKARKMVDQSQSNRLLLEILVWELRIILAPKYNGELKKTVDDIFTEENKILRDLSQINRARHFKFSIEEGQNPNDSDYKKWLDLFPNEIHAMVACEFNRAKATYLQKSQRTSEALQTLRTELEILENTFDLNVDKSAFSKYVSCLEMCIGICHEQKDTQNAVAYLNKLKPKNLPVAFAKSNHLFIKVHTHYFIHLLNQQILLEHPEELRNVLDRIVSSEILWSQKLKWQHVAPLLYLMAIGYRSLGEHTLALQSLRDFFGETLLAGRERLFLDVSWLHIILHYEKGNYETMENAYNSIVRRLKKNKHAAYTDRMLMKLFHQLIYSPRSVKHEHYFSKFKVNLEKEVQSHRNRTFNYAKWSEALMLKNK